VGLAAAFVIQTGVFDIREAKKSDPPAVVEYPEQISGSNATITGHDKNQKPFAIKAAKGQQDKAVKTLVHLQQVVGNFERQSGNPMDVSANSGRYDTATKKFELQGNVVLSEGSTMKAQMEVAEINTLDQSLRSSGPVTVDMKGATIKANSLSVSENGTRILFRGGVKARFVTNTAPAGGGG
jgi:lipopolysaccharide export system protein LptC